MIRREHPCRAEAGRQRGRLGARRPQRRESTLATEQFDLVLLDLGLPLRDGLEILRAMRLPARSGRP